MTYKSEMDIMDEDDLIEIRIPLLVTSDGKWKAAGSPQEMSDPDWSFLHDCCLDDPDVELKNPQQYWITAYVKRPKPREIPGIAKRCPEETNG